MSSTKFKQNNLEFDRIRSDFPIIKRTIHRDVPLIYLDSAATSQKPNQMLDAMDYFYTQQNANIHRGIHFLAEEATAAYEQAREKVSKFVGSPSSKQIIFTRNTTESINLVAYSWARKNLKNGDVIILSEMEHHSNLIPWQILSQDIGTRLEFVPITLDGRLDLNEYVNLLKQNPRLVSFMHMSNVLGTINPAKEMIKLAHDAGAIVLLDGAQSVPHFPVNVQDLDVDFLAFSGHKMCGPSGIGVLYGRRGILENMPPFMGGGDMIKRVQLRSFSTNEIPYKFEAGTPAIAEVIGLGAAVDYLENVGMEKIARYENDLVKYAVERLSEVPGLTLYGPCAENRGGVTSFSLEGIHPHDISQILDSYGIAIRAGHHCAMPLHEKLNIPASARASYYLYNSHEEVNKLIEALYQVKKIFAD
jgi:cysteine desulfurase/selenocysteine lyase